MNEIFKLIGTFVVEGLDAAEKQIESFSKKGSSAGSVLKAVGRGAETVGKGMMTAGKFITAGVTAPLTGVIGMAAKTAISFTKLKESAMIVFEKMLGGKDAADNLYNALLAVASASTFSQETFLTCGKKLVGMGINAKTTTKWLQATTDAVAGFGGSAEQIESVTGAFAKAHAQGKMSMEVMNMLSDAGVNALQILANQYGVTTEEMQEMISKGAVPADESIDKLTDGIENGTEGIAGYTKAMAGMSAELKGKTLTGALDSLNSSVRSFSLGLMGMDTTAQKTTETTEQYEARVASAQNRIDKITAAISTVNSIIPKMTKVLKPVTDAIGTFADKMVGANVTFDDAEKKWTNVGGILGKINEYLTNTDPSKLESIGKVVLTLAKVGPILLGVGKVVQIFGLVMGKLGKAKDLFSNFKGADKARADIEKVTKAVTDAGNSAEKSRSKFAVVMGNIGREAQRAGKLLGSAFAAGLKKLSETAPVQKMKAVVTGVLDAIKNKANSAWTVVSGKAQSAWAKVASGANTVRTKVGTVFTAVGTKAGEAWSKVTDSKFGRAMSKVGSGLKTIGEKAHNSWNRIKDTSAATNGIDKVARAAERAEKRAARLHSVAGGLKKGLAVAGGAMLALGAVMVASGGNFDGITAKINKFAADLPKLVEGFTNALPGMVNALVGAIDQISTMLVTMIPTLVPVLVSALTTLVSALVGAIPTILPPLIQGLLTLITALVTAIGTMIPTLLDAAITLLMAIVEAIPKIIPPLIDALPGIISAIIDAVIVAIPLLIDGAIQLFMAIVNAIPKILPPLIAALPKIIKTIVSVLTKNLPVILDGGIKLLMALIDAIPQILPPLIAALPQIIKSIVGALIKATPQILQATVQALGGILKAIPSVLGSIGSAMLSVGKSLVQGLWNGITDAKDWVLGKIKGFGKSIIDGVKNIFGVHSPSTVFASIGRFLDEGLVGGMKSGLGKVMDMAGTLADAVKITPEVVDMVIPDAVNSPTSAYSYNPGTDLSQNSIAAAMYGAGSGTGGDILMRILNTLIALSESLADKIREGREGSVFDPNMREIGRWRPVNA